MRPFAPSACRRFAGAGGLAVAEDVGERSIHVTGRTSMMISTPPEADARTRTGDPFISGCSHHTLGLRPSS
jgi:hypothetical protein